MSKDINKTDIVLELYNNDLLISEHLQFIIEYCNKYLNISSDFINKLIKDENVTLLDIIFSHLKFYDNYLY